MFGGNHGCLVRGADQMHTITRYDTRYAIGKHRFIPPALSLLQNHNQNELMSESAIVLPKRKQRQNMLLENSRAKRTM
jgi:hypothetical protein